MNKTLCHCSLAMTAFVFIVLLGIDAQSQPSTSSRPGSRATVPQTTQAQTDNYPVQLLEELSAIKSAALADDYAYQQVAHLTENIGPRLSGSAQAQAAVDYVAAELRRLGL